MWLLAEQELEAVEYFFGEAVLVLCPLEREGIGGKEKRELSKERKRERKRGGGWRGR